MNTNNFLKKRKAVILDSGNTLRWQKIRSCANAVSKYQLI